MHVHEMIRSHPHVKGDADEALIRCVEECYDCAQVCASCADACLGEEAIHELTQCVRLTLDCADICATMGKLATRRTGSNPDVLQRMLDACIAACHFCGDECERHAAYHEHCDICAKACRRCELACAQAGRSLGSRH
jgi:hypothetical protein